MRYLHFIPLFLLACSNNLNKDSSNVSNGNLPPDPSLDVGCSGVCPDGGNANSSGGSSGVIVGTDGLSDFGKRPADCGRGVARQCEVGESCAAHEDCKSNACDYLGQCIAEKSCVNHFGGDTCGPNEGDGPQTGHESCCKSLPVNGYEDPSHPGKTVYLDKYEITAGRMRAFTEAVIREMGKPDFKGWLAKHRPEVWDDEWTKFLPSDYEGDKILINRMSLGDPRHLNQTQEQAGPGVIIPPATDQFVSTGLNHQFNGQVFLDTHGNNCGAYPDSFGFPTYWYSDSVLKSVGEVPRSDALDLQGHTIRAQDALDSKPMNCSTGLMFQLFCYWATDGEGQLATSEVLDHITQSPSSLGNTSGCGSQFDNHSIILSGDPAQIDPSIRSGGSCPDLSKIIATFDAGDKLPTIFLGGVEVSDPAKNPGNFLNQHIYWYPNYPANDTSEKVWQIASPGRNVADNINGFMDLAGNLSEQVLETQGGSFTGLFGVKYRGIGYGSERSDLNFSLIGNETIIRLARPESKSALTTSRCMKYK